MFLDLSEVCTSNVIGVVLGPVRNIINLIQIIGPILCIISMTYTFISLMQDPDNKKLKSRIKNSLMALIVLFFIPLLINVTMRLLDSSFEFASCYNNTNYSFEANYIEIESENKKQNPLDSGEYEKGVKKEENNTNSSNNNNNSSNNNNNTNSNNSITTINTNKNNSTCSGGYCSVAHRGYSTKYTANTNQAFIGAGEASFWGSEADLRMSDSGKLVCFHDNDKDLESKTSFSDYLDICKKYNMTAVIDMKACRNCGKNSIHKAIDMVKQKGMLQKAVFQCSMTSYLKIVREYEPNARIWYLRNTYDNSVINTAKSVGAEAVNINYANTNQNAITSMHNANLKVCVYVVNSQKTKQTFLNYGADYIMSNLPL